eukprot:m.34551 g.34551  ORF g.34551 m.34551 type:complete len:245 (+) comp8748_c0_seq2:1944-2678(+)
MSVDYLRVFVETADSCPDDVQRYITQLQQKIDIEAEILQDFDSIKESLQKNGKHNESTLRECKDKLNFLVAIQRERHALCSQIQDAIEDSKKILDREKEDYESGAYLRRDERDRYASRDSPSDINDVDDAPYPEPDRKKTTKRPRSSDSKNSSPVPPKTKRKKNKAKKQRPRYCVPNCTANDSEMVGCDNAKCANGEWFHLSCVGLKVRWINLGLQSNHMAFLKVAPTEDKKWFCPGCRKAKKK